MAPALEIRDLHKSFHAGAGACVAHARVLAGASLEVAPGEIVALVGARGAGKTTLLLCAAGLLRPDRGEVRWEGEPARAGGRTRRARLVRPWDVEIALPAPGHAVHEAAPRLERAEAPALLLVDDAVALAPAPRRVAARLRALAASGTAIVAALRGDSLHGERWLREAGARVARLADGRIDDGAPPAPPQLELHVREPGLARHMLAARLPGVHCVGQRIRVPLAGASAEEVLAHCVALRIAVDASRVVT